MVLISIKQYSLLLFFICAFILDLFLLEAFSCPLPTKQKPHLKIIYLGTFHLGSGNLAISFYYYFGLETNPQVMYSLITLVQSNPHVYTFRLLILLTYFSPVLHTFSLLTVKSKICRLIWNGSTTWLEQN